MAKHKKYHQSFKDREHEHRGMERSEHKEYGRRMAHMREHEMIENDEHEIANMPQNVVMKKYTYPEMMDDRSYNDGPSGIEEQMDHDHGKLRKQFAPHKF